MYTYTSISFTHKGILKNFLAPSFPSSLNSYYRETPQVTPDTLKKKDPFHLITLVLTAGIISLSSVGYMSFGTQVIPA